MKSRIILFGSLALLLAAMLFMAWDMFFNRPDPAQNPYDYDMKSLRTADTVMAGYTESAHFTPAMTAITGIAIDRNDLIYICGGGSVAIHDSRGIKLRGFSIKGNAGCIQVDQAGRIYLGMADHIEVYDTTGTLLKSWAPCSDNTVITSIAACSRGVFAADAGCRVVYHYDLSGKLLNEIGQKDPARGISGFVVPSPYFDLGLGPNGELWVVNPGHHRFEQYDFEGNLLSSWGESSMAEAGFCGCCNPSNFAFFPDGSIVTSEKGIERIKIYAPDGRFSCVVAGPGSFIEGTSGLDVAVDSEHRIVVLDPEKKQVRIFVLSNSVN